MNQSLLIIDALNLIRRIYSVQTSHNQDITQCASQVAHACRKLIRTVKPTHAIAIFDGDRSWRYHYYPQYKHSRKPMPDELKVGLEQIGKTISELNITTFFPEQDEADDVIATLATKCLAANVPSVIVSTDKGFLPLLDLKVQVYDYFKREYLTHAHIETKFGVKQQQLTSLWALAGDKTNDIPGVAGIGIKTAQSLLSKHSNLEEIINDSEVKPKIKEKLNADLDNFILSKNLVSLRTDIHLGFSLKNLRLNKSL